MADKDPNRPDIEMTWASALRVAAGVAREAAASEVDVLRAVTEELRRMSLDGTVALMAPDGQLEIKTRAISFPVESALRHIVGLDISGQRFDPQQIEPYQEALSTRKPVFVTNQTNIIDRIMPTPLGPVRSRILGLLSHDHPMIIAPLILADHLLGAISVTAQWIAAEDIPMVTALADHISIALGQVRARAEMQTTLNREQLRNQVIEELASSHDISMVLERVIRLASEATGAAAGAMALIDPSGETITYPYLFGLPESLRFKTTPRNQGLAWLSIKTRTPILLREYGEHPDALSHWNEAGVHSFIGVPLIAGDEAIGAIGLFALSKDRIFEEEQVEVAQAIASVAAIAVRKAQLYSDATRRAEELQALIRTARSISTSLDYETVLQLIAEQAKSLLQADGSRIHLAEPEAGKLRCLVALGPDAEAMMGVELEIGQGTTGYVAEQGMPILLNDPSSDTQRPRVDSPLGDGPECLALAPLKVRHRTIGVMTVRRLGVNRPFTVADLELLTAFATQAAVALENAHLYGQIASQAQRLEVEVAERTYDLALSEAHYRALVETSLAGIIKIDTEGTFTYVNQAFTDLLEIAPEELIGKPITSYPGFNPELHQNLIDRFQARMHGEREPKESYEFEFITTSGRHIPVLVAVSIISDERGAPAGVTAMMFDISARKSLEAALQTERDRLDALLTNVGDAIMVTDPNGIIEYVNPGWERLNGYSAEEALGQTPRLIQSGHHSEDFYTDMWEAINSGRTWRGEVVNLHKDGSFYDAALTITPVLNDAGEVINLVGVQHDISALKELDRIKDQFVSDVSHELRTPLTNICLYLDLLKRTRDDPDKTARYLETLTRESERLTNLINDLLSLSSLNADAVAFEPATLDIIQILKGLVEDRGPLAASRDLNLTLETDGEIPKLTGDERMLIQVFNNLLTNAMNYTSDGGRIALRAYKRTWAKRKWVVVEVEDNGLGIPPDEITMIFRRFYRGRASQKTSIPGTGLGLPICKEIIDRHNGRITVESDGVPGRGSRFFVWLPSLDNK